MFQAIEVVEHAEFVVHCPEERLIYLQACHDYAFQSLSELSLESRAALLKRCSHFCRDATDATQALRLLGDEKRLRIVAVQGQIELEACRAVHLECWELVKDELLRCEHAEACSFMQRLHAMPAELWRAKEEVFARAPELPGELCEGTRQGREVLFSA